LNREMFEKTIELINNQSSRELMAET
jgi:hypothetical protein